MSNERMTSAQFRELGAAKKPRVGSKRSTEPNPYRGLLCEVCGKLVRSMDPAWLETTVDPEGRTAGVTARHLNAEDCKVETPAEAGVRGGGGTA